MDMKTEMTDYRSQDEAIEQICGRGIKVEDRRMVGGGDINDAYLLHLSDGRSLFLKENTRDNANFFLTESQGLEALSKTNAIGVPKVYTYGTYGSRSFLLMEYLPAGRQSRTFWEDFGHSLAEMHTADTSFLGLPGRFGFGIDNYIGAGPQKNTPKDSWIEFFRDCRLAPQLERASRKMPVSDIKKADHLLEHLGEYLIEPDRASILHGDLWSGNYVVGPDGNAWLIDPAVYVGCSETDIAMTELFGGFSYAFYGAYRESGLLKPGYEERCDIYNLYHMLNHLNLFGGGYLYSVERIISKY